MQKHAYYTTAAFLAGAIDTSVKTAAPKALSYFTDMLPKNLANIGGGSKAGIIAGRQKRVLYDNLFGDDLYGLPNQVPTFSPRTNTQSFGEASGLRKQLAQHHPTPAALEAKELQRADAMRDYARRVQEGEQLAAAHRARGPLVQQRPQAAPAEEASVFMGRRTTTPNDAQKQRDYFDQVAMNAAASF